MSGTSDKSPIYRLYGVVVHLDIMNAAFSGHYVCYVKNIQNKWFKIDDSMVCFFLGQFAFLACLTTKIVISLKQKFILLTLVVVIVVLYQESWLLYDCIISSVTNE